MTGPPAAVPRRSGPLADLLDLVVPASCAACADPGPVLCADCATGWLPAPIRCEQDAGRLDRMDGRPPLPVWAQAVYQGAVRRAVLAWKDQGRAELSAWLATRTADAAEAITPVLSALAGPAEPAVPPPHAAAVHSAPAGDVPLACALPPVPAPAARSVARVLVIPAPPSAAGRRRRGEDLLLPLARAAATGLTASGLPATPLAGLRARPARRDQVGLGRRARGLNLADRIRPRRALPAAPHRVLLVDDVLTTGATLAACRAVFDAAGHTVVGALVLAATPSPTHRCARLEPEAAPG